MNEAHEGRNQADKLVRGFKRTGLEQPIVEWQPKPTGGDAARSVVADLDGERVATLEGAAAKSLDLWRG
jgi:hypothetical protein